MAREMRVTACAMENNIPSVGEADAGYGRGMHWIRTERFWNGVYPNISTGYQPMLCQQCGHAPCEPVCHFLIRSSRLNTPDNGSPEAIWVYRS